MKRLEYRVGGPTATALTVRLPQWLHVPPPFGAFAVGYRLVGRSESKAAATWWSAGGPVAELVYEGCPAETRDAQGFFEIVPHARRVLRGRPGFSGASPPRR